MGKLQAPPVSLLDKYRGANFEPLYATRVTVTGGEARHGRASGTARSDDGELDVQLRLPVAMGGEGGGTNPEQLFAAGYGACFHGALHLLARRHDMDIPDGSVDVEIAFGRDPVDGWHALTAQVTVRLPGMGLKLAEELVRATERICPYAKLVRQGIECHVRVVV
ncbi:Ohr family peroxiredoxin [Streptococcus pyogenes]|uniref:Ohr family peroxiredoxin n=1 Tax=Streptococcus pyogenes TaxID=1314 RepID=UPI003DA04351